MAASVQVGVKEAHDPHAQERDPENRVEQEGAQAFPRTEPACAVPEKCFIQNEGEQNQGCQRRTGQQQGSHEIVAGGGQGTRQKQDRT